MPKNVLLQSKRDGINANLENLKQKGFNGVVAAQLIEKELIYTCQEFGDPKRQAFAIYHLVELLRQYNQINKINIYNQLINDLEAEAKRLAIKEQLSHDYLQFILERKYIHISDKDQNYEKLGDISKSAVARVAPIDLRKCPQAGVPREGEWLSFGDMHGNALKLLHILIMTNAGRFPHEKKDMLYRQFMCIYHLTQDDWDRRTDIEAKELMNIMDQVIDQLVVSDQMNLRLIGDLLADRGSNDYFTLRLIQKCIEKNPAAFEILLSNHDIEALVRHFNDQPLSNERYSIHERYSNQDDQTQSMENLHYFLRRGLVTPGRVNDLFNPYLSALKLVAYDLPSRNNPNDLMIHSHAPVNPINIFMAGLCLVDPKNEAVTRDLINDEQRRTLNSILEKVKTGASLNNGDLILIIDVLNAASKTCVMKQNKQLLNAFLDLKIQTEYEITRPNQAPEKMRFSPGDPKKDLGPIRFFCESRIDPFLAMKASNINVTECRIWCTHGHTGTDKRSYFINELASSHPLKNVLVGCVNTDTEAGKYVLGGNEEAPLPYTCTLGMTPEHKNALVAKSESRPQP